MLKEFTLENKTALITGGSAGIGKAIALVYAEAGADVAITARGLDRLEEAADEIRKLGHKVVAIQADVSDRQQVDDLVAKATAELGRIDVLVNNVGSGGGAFPVAPLPDPPTRPQLGFRNPRDWTVGMSDEVWHTVLNRNMGSTFFCCRAVVPAMLERRSGKVINIGSTNGTMAYPYNAAYQSAKAGLKIMTKVMAAEWGRYNVNVNVIQPGWYVTEATRPAFENPEMADWAKEQTAWLPLRRLTDTRDLGLLALYLGCSASDWMTGQVISLDGGETLIVG